MRNHIKIYHEDMAKNAPQVNTIYKWRKLADNQLLPYHRTNCIRMNHKRLQRTRMSQMGTDGKLISRSRTALYWKVTRQKARTSLLDVQIGFCAEWGNTERFPINKKIIGTGWRQFSSHIWMGWTHSVWVECMRFQYRQRYQRFTHRVTWTRQSDLFPNSHLAGLLR